MWAKCDPVANSFHPGQGGCLMRVTNLSFSSLSTLGRSALGHHPKIFWSSWHRLLHLWVLSTYCQTGLLWVHHHHHHPWVEGQQPNWAQAYTAESRVLARKYYLFTVGNIWMSCPYRCLSADSSEERQQTQTEASIPSCFLFFLSSLPMRAGIPGRRDPSSGMVGWREFWQCMLF